MPRDFFEPSTLEEIQAIVRMAHSSGRHIRVCGALHSPNDCAMSEDVLVSLRKFNQVRAVDRARRMIMVRALRPLFDCRIGEEQVTHPHVYLFPLYAGRSRHHAQ